MNTWYITIAQAAEAIRIAEACGGLALWGSANLSDPGRVAITGRLHEGQPTAKPHWWCTDQPVRTSVDLADIDVVEDKVEKVVRVHIEMSSNGMMLKCTDASSRKVRAALKKLEDRGISPYYRSAADALGPTIEVLSHRRVCSLAEYRTKSVAPNGAAR